MHTFEKNVATGHCNQVIKRSITSSRAPDMMCLQVHSIIQEIIMPIMYNLNPVQPLDLISYFEQRWDGGTNGPTP